MGGSGKGSRVVQRLVIWILLVGALLIAVAAVVPRSIAAKDRSDALRAFRQAVGGCREIVVQEYDRDEAGGRPGWRTVRTVADPVRIAEVVERIDILPNRPLVSWACGCGGQQKLLFKTASGTVDLAVHHGESLACGLWQSQYYMTADCCRLVESLAKPPTSQPAG